jgi:hypothetical protein
VWPRVFVVLLLVCFGLLRVDPTVAQADAVELQVKVTKGETVYHLVRSTLQLAIDAAGTRSNVDGQSEGRRAVRVLDVNPDGVMLTEVTTEDFRTTVAGRTQESIDAPWSIQVAPSGRVVERLVGAEHLDDFPLPLPGRPVRVGESWTRELTMTESGFTARATGTYTLAALEGADDARTARIRINITGTVTGAQLGQLPPGTQVRVSGTIRASGETRWSVPRGRVVTESAEMTVDVQADTTVQGQSARVRLTLRVGTRHEPIAAESVTAPQVSPDLVIMAGRGIGAFTLALSAAEFTNLLSEPEELPPGAGSSTPRVRWRNGLIGHLDPADRTKVTGLQVTERGYQTEKGLKFGSSEGAVLTAYGFTPVKVNVTLPNIGGVRLLIYNDQGIAFAITSDAEHAGRGPSHAPIGAVDWITVFPVGGAGKIYALP